MRQLNHKSKITPDCNRVNRFLKLPQVLAMFPVSKTSWYTGIQSGLYPKPHNIGSRSVAWLESDIMALIEGVCNGK